MVEVINFVTDVTMVKFKETEKDLLIINIWHTKKKKKRVVTAKFSLQLFALFFVSFFFFYL